MSEQINNPSELPETVTSGKVVEDTDSVSETTAEQDLAQDLIVGKYPDNINQLNATNVSQEYEVVKKGSENKQLNIDEEVIHHLSHPLKDTASIIETVRDVTENDSQAARNFTQGIPSALTTATKYAQFEAVVENTNSLFKQYLQTEKGKIGYQVPKFADSDVNKVSGEKALIRLRSLLGQGSIISIPLYHSGFWITIRTPKETELLELHRRIQEDKVLLGRATAGLIFSNMQTFTINWLMELVGDLFMYSTLKDSTDWKSKVKSLDIPTIIWGLASTIWPNGYQYTRSILTEKGIKEKKLVTGKIDVSKLFWVDNNALTEQQKAHMSNRTQESVTDDMLVNYCSQFPKMSGRQVEINENVSITLKVPTLTEYVASGYKWVSDISTSLESVFTSESTDPETRTKAMFQHAQLSNLRQWSHWIESIVYDEVGHKERQFIDEALTIFSSDTEISKKIFEEVSKYINDVTISVIAIPETNGEETSLPRFPRLIPIDVVMVFFSLLQQRVDRLLST